MKNFSDLILTYPVSDEMVNNLSEEQAKQYLKYLLVMLKNSSRSNEICIGDRVRLNGTVGYEYGIIFDKKEESGKTLFLVKYDCSDKEQWVTENVLTIIRRKNGINTTY